MALLARRFTGYWPGPLVDRLGWMIWESTGVNQESNKATETPGDVQPQAARSIPERVANDLLTKRKDEVMGYPSFMLVSITKRKYGKIPPDIS